MKALVLRPCLVDLRDPYPRSRHVFAFHKPETTYRVVVSNNFIIVTDIVTEKIGWKDYDKCIYFTNDATWKFQ